MRVASLRTLIKAPWTNYSVRAFFPNIEKLLISFRSEDEELPYMVSLVFSSVLKAMVHDTDRGELGELISVHINRWISMNTHSHKREVIQCLVQ